MKAKTASRTGTPAAPYDALLKASGMWTPVPAQFVEGWQRQLNAGLRIMDAALGNAVKVRDAQLPAAGEFLARAAELQQSMLDARSPLALWSVQCNWMIESTTRGLALGESLFDAATAADPHLW